MSPALRSRESTDEVEGLRERVEFRRAGRWYIAKLEEEGVAGQGQSKEEALHNLFENRKRRYKKREKQADSSDLPNLIEST